MRKFVMIVVMVITMPFLNVGFASAESFVEKMKPYVGRVLNADEIRQVLVGNTLYHSAESKKGRFRDIFYYFRTKTELTIVHEVQAPGGFNTTWSVSEKNGKGRYCRKSLRHGGKFCRWNTRLSIVDGDVMVTFFNMPKKGQTTVRNKDRIMKLIQGERFK